MSAQSLLTPQAAELPLGWTLSVNAFNWTWEVIDARRSVRDILLDIPGSGVAGTLEIELGQIWPGFPAPAKNDVEDLRVAIEDAGGQISIVGASIDEWKNPDRRRDDDERLAFLYPQLRAAHLLGAHAVRLPLGQCGQPLLQRILPILHDLDLVLYEEFQGSQVPGTEAADRAFSVVADLDDHRVRLLSDISCLMPSLPVSYLEALEASGMDAADLSVLKETWAEPGTHAKVVQMLRDGRVPAGTEPLFANMLIRFGRSRARILRDVLPLVGAVHLKFWDLDDKDGRISEPVRELGSELARAGFKGTLCSEWGGQEWLENEGASDITRQHIGQAKTWLAEGAAR
jgi:hypothetical protein